MTFKDNLLKKIEIEQLVGKILNSIGAPDSMQKIDREAMVRLLAMLDFSTTKERDLDLYVRPTDDGKQEILVLDNELALYRTTVADVALRKSPTIKEMISIRNAIKILNDKDVVLAKRRETVLRLEEELIGSLDLSYSASDISLIISDGAASLEKAYGEGVAECLMLMAEVIGYQKPPKALMLNHQVTFGALEKKNDGATLFGPMITYDRIHNILRYIDRQVDISKKEQILEWKEEISSTAQSERMGERVLLHLSSMAKSGGSVENRRNPDGGRSI